MSLLLWLLWLVATIKEEEESWLRLSLRCHFAVVCFEEFAFRKEENDQPNPFSKLTNLSFIFRYAVVVGVVVLVAFDRVLLARRLAFDRPPASQLHLVVLVLFLYAQIVRICSSTFASCSDMLL
jgi:hypothetical protein